jgi:integrase
MNLIDLADSYLADRLGLSDSHRADVRSVALRCARDSGHCNGSLPSPPEVAAWLQAALDRGRSPACVARYRRILAALWRWGAERGFAFPVALPTVKQPLRLPEAWTVAEVNRLLCQAARQAGHVGPHDAADWWLALILVVYWTGARIGSILAAAPEDWDSAAALLSLRQTKNGRAAVYRLHVQAADALSRIVTRDAARLFVWPHSRWNLFRRFRQIVEAAGVPCPTHKRFGLFHRLRRTTISYCWAADPGLAQRQADHSSSEITRRHYVDPRIVIANSRSAADVLPVPKF